MPLDKFEYKELGIPSISVTKLDKNCQSFFVRQKDVYSCGPACAATVSKILGYETGYDYFRSVARPSTVIGTPTNRLFDACTPLSPVSEGEHTYNEGLAISSILQLPEMDGHYVVFLGCRNEGELTYYCPFYHRIFQEPLEQIHWQSGYEDKKAWTINFKTPPVINEIIAEAVQAIKIEKDTYGASRGK